MITHGQVPKGRTEAQQCLLVGREFEIRHRMRSVVRLIVGRAGTSIAGSTTTRAEQISRLVQKVIGENVNYPAVSLWTKF